MNENFPAQVPDGREIGLGRVWDDLQSKSKFPLNLMLAITHSCNLTCHHCFVDPPKKKDDLSILEIEELLNDLAKLGILVLTLTGGEPAIRDDLEEIVAAATSRKFAVKLKTNAYLLTKPRIESLISSGLSEVHVSIYSDLPELHDTFVGMKGAWKQAVSTLDTFKKAGVNVMVSSNIMAMNADRIGRLIDLCEQRGFGYTFDPRVVSSMDGKVVGSSLRASEELLLETFKDVRLLDSKELATNTLRKDDDVTCSAGTGNGYIGPKGDVMLCAFLPTELGNIREHSFEKIWLESETRKQFIETKWKDLEKCGTCELSWACSRCPGAALSEVGSIKGASPEDCVVAAIKATICGRNGKGTV